MIYLRIEIPDSGWERILAMLRSKYVETDPDDLEGTRPFTDEERIHMHIRGILESPTFSYERGLAMSNVDTTDMGISTTFSPGGEEK